MSKPLDTFDIFRLEKAIPTHCPKCAQPFRTNSAAGFMYDFRWKHPDSTPEEWQTVFPEAAVTEGLEVEPVWCGKCRNVTLRIITAVRHVATAEEAVELERLGYTNRRVMSCSGESFSRHPDYNLKVVLDPELEHYHFTIFPRQGRRNRPRSG